MLNYQEKENTINGRVHGDSGQVSCANYQDQMMKSTIDLPENLTIEQFEQLLAKCNSENGRVVEKEDGTVMMWFGNGHKKQQGHGSDFVQLKKLGGHGFHVEENYELYKS